MTGIIVLGHDNFANGISGSLEMLLGKMENYEKVNYLQDDSLDDLAFKLAEAVKRLSSCSGFLFFADITGGTPFNTAIELKEHSSRPIEVIGGANIAAVLHGYMSRAKEGSLSVLAEECVASGQSALHHFKEDDDDSLKK